MFDKTLVLTNGYEPLEIISWQRALTLVFSNKAEIIEEHDHDVRSVYLVIKMPSVVRLLSAFRRHKNKVKFSRINIFARDRYTCQYCGIKHKLSELTYDHVLPRAQGGTTKWANITTACKRCNGQKKDRTPEQAKMRLLSKPIQPTWVPVIALQVSRTSCPDAWRDYLFWTGELDQEE